jgi:hypothetical protein
MARVRFPAGQEIFVYTTAFRPVLRPTQPHIEWVPGIKRLPLPRMASWHSVGLINDRGKLCVPLTVMRLKLLNNCIVLNMLGRCFTRNTPCYGSVDLFPPKLCISLRILGWVMVPTTVESPFTILITWQSVCYANKLLYYPHSQVVQFAD